MTSLAARDEISGLITATAPLAVNLARVRPGTSNPDPSKNSTHISSPDCDHYFLNLHLGMYSVNLNVSCQPGILIKPSSPITCHNLFYNIFLTLSEFEISLNPHQVYGTL